jgi:hypothetical protein
MKRVGRRTQTTARTTSWQMMTLHVLDFDSTEGGKKLLPSRVGRRTNRGGRETDRGGHSQRDVQKIRLLHDPPDIHISGENGVGAGLAEEISIGHAAPGLVGHGHQRYLDLDMMMQRRGRRTNSGGWETDRGGHCSLGGMPTSEERDVRTIGAGLSRTIGAGPGQAEEAEEISIGPAAPGLVGHRHQRYLVHFQNYWQVRTEAAAAPTAAVAANWGRVGG